jgi:hypothetical protein
MNKMVKIFLFHTLGIAMVLSLIIPITACITAFNQLEGIRIYQNSESQLKSTYLPVRKRELLREGTITIMER